jgi:hypothetical protein
MGGPVRVGSANLAGKCPLAVSDRSTGNSTKIADIVRLVEGRQTAIDNDADAEWKMGSASI